MLLKNKCIQFKNSTDETNQELYFYGDIVSDESMKMTNADVCPEDIQDVLSQIDESKPLDIYINSGGGSVFAGISIYNMLKRSKCDKTVYIDGLAGSIASVIAMVGDTIIMPSNAFLMIHKPLCIIQGNATDMVQMAGDLDKIQEGIMNIYAQKLAKDCDIQTIQDLVNAETWIVGSDAGKYFNVTVTEANKMVASISDLSIYNNVPKGLIANDSVITPESAGCLCDQCTNTCCINCGNDCSSDQNDKVTVPIKDSTNKSQELELLKLKLQLEDL